MRKSIVDEVAGGRLTQREGELGAGKLNLQASLRVVNLRELTRKRHPGKIPPLIPFILVSGQRECICA